MNGARRPRLEAFRLLHPDKWARDWPKRPTVGARYACDRPEARLIVDARKRRTS